MIGKLLATAFFLAISSSALATELKTSKVKEYLKKNGNCWLAVGLSDPSNPLKDDPVISDDVLCVSDITIAEGTVNEVKGCGLSILNVSTGNMRKASFNPMMNPRAVEPAIIKGSKCDSGGIDKLFDSHFETIYAQGPKIADFLVKGPSGTRTSLVYADNESIKQKYDSAVKAFEKKQAESKQAADNKKKK